MHYKAQLLCLKREISYAKVYYDAFPAIDYSDASMNEARSTLATISAFSHSAQAYMQGYLLCQSIEEGTLWER